MTIYIASDHGGFELKNFLVKELKNNGFVVEDAGPFEYNALDNYPETTKEALKRIQENPKCRAILICRNGVGVNIFANRHKNVRAGLSWETRHAKSHRLDDNTNVLTLPADYITKKQATKIAIEWLKTEFSKEDRHIKRIEQIEGLS